MGKRAVLLVGAVVLAALYLTYGTDHDRPAGPGFATFEQPANSPSGKYRLVVVRGYDGNVHFATFQITTNEPNPGFVYCARWHFRTFNTTYFLWGPGDRVWVYSGDLGLFYWTPAGGSDWAMHTYDGSDGPVPPALKGLLPPA